MWLWRFFLSLRKISSWNVNSVRARIENIKDYLNKFSPNILLMQEIKTEEKNFPFNEFEDLGYHSYVFGQKSYNGVAIISKKKLENVSTDTVSYTHLTLPTIYSV